MATIHDRLCLGLALDGHEKETNSRSSKYTVFIDARIRDRRFFVGHAGALRWGRNRIQSAVCSAYMRDRLLKLADEKMAAEARAEIARLTDAANTAAFYAPDARLTAPLGASAMEHLRFRLCCGKDHCDAANHAVDHGMSAAGYAERYGCEGKEITAQAEACIPVLKQVEREARAAAAQHVEEECVYLVGKQQAKVIADRIRALASAPPKETLG